MTVLFDHYFITIVCYQNFSITVLQLLFVISILPQLLLQNFLIPAFFCYYFSTAILLPIFGTNIFLSPFCSHCWVPVFFYHYFVTTVWILESEFFYQYFTNIILTPLSGISKLFMTINLPQFCHHSLLPACFYH